jgi:hypothetical protein
VQVMKINSRIGYGGITALILTAPLILLLEVMNSL